MNRATVAQRLSVLAYRGGWAVVKALPEPFAYRLFDVIADLAWWRRGTGVRRLEANLARVRPDLDDAGLRALSRAGMRSYLRYWCDAFRLPTWSRERLLATVRVEGDQPLRAELAAGRGVVVALAHQGNWDHAGAWSTFSLEKVTTVAERLEPEEVFTAFLRFRERLGMEIVPLNGGPPVFPTLLRRLRDGAFVPLLADRDLSATGVEVTFFGEPARMAAGPATLALTAGVALHPASIWYERLPAGAAAPWGIVIHFHPRVEAPGTGDRAQKVADMTQRCADAIARGIAEHPEDWHMLQRVFAADLDPPVSRS
ncbi:MAG: phosphatidylinositol mannoside acyltransferase [Actinomycetes bacterium]